MNTKRNSFILYKDMLNAHIHRLTMEERGELLTAICDYQTNGKTEELSRIISFIFPQFQQAFDRDSEKYERICQRRAEAGRRGNDVRWNIANATNQSQMRQNSRKSAKIIADSDSVSDSEIDSDEEKNIKKEPSDGIYEVAEMQNVCGEEMQENCDGPRPKCQIPPDFLELRAYIESRGDTFSAEQFYDFYQAKGWFIGKTKMKDWKAAVRTWERNIKNSPRQNGQILTPEMQNILLNQFTKKNGNNC